MDRREFLKVLPGIGLLGKPGSEEARPFEEELRQMLEHSPHLARIQGGGVRVWLDGFECEWSNAIVGSPQPGVAARGAVRVCIARDGGMARSIDDIFCRGDEIATEWRIGTVVWRLA